MKEINLSIKEKPFNKLIHQVHGNKIVVIHNSEDYQKLLNSPPEADGILTYDLSLPIFIYTADCLPIALFGKSQNKKFKALLHCGWRGAKTRILKNALTLLPEITDLEVYFGPCILSCCFEVKTDLLKAFSQENISVEHFIKKREDKMFLNLPQLVEEVEGVKANLTLMRCTFCSRPQLPSYRRERSLQRLCTTI